MHFSDNSLHEHITVCLFNRLQALAYMCVVLALTNYAEWKHKMAEENKIWASKHATKAQELMQLYSCFAKLAAPSYSMPHAPALVLSGLTSSSATNTKQLTPIPSLMDAEHQLLHDHKGCFCCCHFYAGHLQRNCKDWPARPIQVLTLGDALTTQKASEGSTKGPKPTHVAAVSATDSSVSQADSNDKSDEDFSYTLVAGSVAAVFASTTVGALSMDDKDVWSFEYI